ncbi:putative transcription factor bHLH family [Helianthus annuus]|nr:putative transcription factor bHLH family [Helianthus annuus]KAJ0662343.1 putative transcription factor bHLH family [Helianthus annuus]KAJ0847643.1 putative transcription factor bHLH family [Helianthus annuus]KAJ0856577.1 putative transcription factor bHLH family [Helianthus annuus]
MKFLQDLVSGFSKVTGKAVMLDEIINYVQSLQRQVKAMKSRLGPSGSLVTDMAMSCALNQSQMVIMQGRIFGVGRSSDAGRRTVNSHLVSISGGFKDPASQHH